MKKQLIGAFMLALAGLTPAHAQTEAADSTTTVQTVDSTLVSTISELRAAINKSILEDSLIVNKYNTLIEQLAASSRKTSVSADDDSDGNPLFFRLVTPLTLYSSPIRNALQLTTDSTTTADDDDLAPRLQLPWEKDLALMDELDKLLLVTYLKDPTKVSQTEERLMENSSVSGETMKKSTDNAVLNVATGGTIEQITAAGPTDMVVKRPNFWTTKGSMSNQWTENYFTSNWYQGGTSQVNIMSTLILDANYDDKQKLSWTNRLEGKVGFYMNNFYKSVEEGRSKVQSNTDLLRFTSTLNLKAIKSWNYSAQFQGYTQMMNVYNGDEDKVKSCFMSPSYASFSVGMNWSKAIKKGSMSAFIGPITYNCRYVMDKGVLENFGGSYIPGGKDQHPNGYYHDYGSKVEVNFNYPITKSISYRTRAFYYTTYHYVQAEWENTFNFQVSKYLSSQLFFHTRFDDSRQPDEKLKYFMFKEYLTLGFNYSW